MRLFAEIEEAPPDAIFGIAAAFNADPRPEKVNLGVGIYRDAELRVPVLETVRRVERELADHGPDKNYLPIDGDPEYVALTSELLFGEQLPQVYGAQTVGSTSALRIAGELLSSLLGHKKIYLPNPTWANHKAIFSRAGLQVESFPYYDWDRCALVEGPMLESVPHGSAVLFHAVCQNPTGVDPDPERWRKILEAVQERSLLPIFDCAYQGLGVGLDEDAAAVRSFAAAGVPFFVTYSYSKNLALYSERIGGLFVVDDAAQRFGSQVRAYARALYSNPGLHGAQIVKGVLSQYRVEWMEELRVMNQRISAMRRTLQERLGLKFLSGQKGLFSFIGLTKEQSERLTNEFAIYLPKSGRISVTGLNDQNIDYVIKALEAVM